MTTCVYDGSGVGVGGTSVGVNCTPTAGNAIAVIAWELPVGGGGTVTCATVGGTGSDTFSLAGTYNDSTLGLTFQVFTLASIGASRTQILVSFTSSPSNSGLVVYEINGLTSITLDKFVNVQNQAGSPFTVGPTGTLSNSNEVAIVYGASSNACTGISSGSGWSGTGTGDAIDADGDIMAHQVVVATTSLSAGITQTGTGGALIATFMAGSIINLTPQALM